MNSSPAWARSMVQAWSEVQRGRKKFLFYAKLPFPSVSLGETEELSLWRYQAYTFQQLHTLIAVLALYRK